MAELPVAVVFIYSEGPFQVSRVGRKQRALVLRPDRLFDSDLFIIP